MVFVTGDTHYPTDAGKLFAPQEGFPFATLQRTDYVIVLGDFGLFWRKRDKYNASNMRKIQELPYTVLFLDGNHENFDWLEEFPVIEKFGGKVQWCGKNILHLMRGEIYTIEGKRFFVCGGATSMDQEFRRPYVSWWPMENVTNEEKQNALNNLDKTESVDFVLTHTCPASVFTPMFERECLWDPTANFLDIIAERLPDVPWYFGHHHEDKDFGHYHALYERVLRII